MSDSHIEQLKALEANKDFFVGIDSDGCAFDTMEPKHKACFYPMTVQHWNMAAIATYVRDVWDFVNLYSQARGTNRFLALLATFDLLDDWPEVAERGFKSPQVDALREWVKVETKLGNPALEAKVAEDNDPVLRQALAWSLGINEQVANIVHDVPPYPHVRESLVKLAGVADIMVVSATPNEALQREWEEHDIAQYVRMICGQEMGSKAEHLQYGAGGKYAPEKILMVGDAPGDMKAAKANNALFYPINPGNEAACWKRFYEEAADKFLAGQYGGEYEQQLIDEFMSYLPSDPPWKK